MQFKDVIGQEPLKAELTNLMQENRLAHALLFLGKEGSGALPLALAFAQYILCTHQSPAAEAGPSLFGDLPPAAEADPALKKDACGLCSSCQKAAAIAHPDIHFSYPVVTKKSGHPPISTDYITEWREFIGSYPYGNVFDWLQFIGAENKQGNITATECNDIIRKLSLKSFEGGYKVLLLWLPEYLGNEGNRLLKLIEEPPEKTVFLLVAENDSLILPTILSRCQLIKVPSPTEEAIRDALIQHQDTAPDIAARTASISEGNYREALQLIQSAGDDWHRMLRDWLNSILKEGPVSQSKWVDETAQLGRERQKQFLRYFDHLLQLALKMRVLPELASQYPQQEADFAARLNQFTDIAQQEAILDELGRAIYYIERNANSKILFMALTIKLCHIIRDNVVFLSE